MQITVHGQYVSSLQQEEKTKTLIHQWLMVVGRHIGPGALGRERLADSSNGYQFLKRHIKHHEQTTNTLALPQEAHLNPTHLNWHTTQTQSPQASHPA